MGGMFYSLKDVVSKLKKTEDEISALVKQGRLREFRDGPNVLFKIDEVNSLMSDTTFIAAQQPAETAKEEEVELLIEGDDTKGKSPSDTTAVASEGINVLGETETELSMSEDTLAETMAASSGATSIIDSSLGGTQAAADEASLQEIEENVNLDTFGSGSGLLDLSLQADDTSLGGILDEIYTPEGGEGKEKAKEGTAAEMVAEADQMIETQEQPPATEAQMEEVGAATMPEAVAYVAEPMPDAKSNMLGYMLFVPLLATIYTIVVALIGQKNISSPVLALKGLIWPIVGGAIVLTGIMAGASLMVGGTKVPKVKKEKKPKKGKKGKEEEAPKAEEPAKAEVEAAPEVAKEMPQLEAEAGTAESADLFTAEVQGSGEDLKLDDLDLSDLENKDDDKI